MQNSSYIVQSKNNNLIQKSSSGGMFAELAKYTLSQDGVVFGCTMERIDDGFDVKHIYIEDEKELYRLQGSKYVQSNLKNTIREAKEFLDNGRPVLFSGTPCQIAGLKAYLKKDYENLITVDLSCEGTPSLKIFNDYIRHLERNVIKHRIVDLKFRPKNLFGWQCGVVVVVVYQDEEKLKEKVLYTNLSSYFSNFFNGNILQDRCFKCKYTGIDRISDITIGDAWGIEKEYPELLKSKFSVKKGISLVLVNSEKGQKIFETVSKNLIINDVDIRKLRKYNHPLRHPSIKSSKWNLYINEYNKNGYQGLEDLFKKELGKKYYYYILKNHTPKLIRSIIKIFMPKQEKTDCLLMTWFFINNYGSILTSYSLYKALEKLGFSSKFIHSVNLFGYSKTFAKKYLPLTNMCINNKDYSKLNRMTETFILGSDNLINLETNSFDEVSKNLFNFTFPSKKRLIISGSIGAWDGTTNNQEEYDYIKYLFKRFDYISTREEYGKEVLEKTFDIKADWINDPVFYLEKQDFVDLTKEVKEDYSNNIMQYILYPTNKTQEIVGFYKQKLGLETVKFNGNENVKYYSRLKNISVENWLSAVINSKLIITDSFHCVAFCLIFNRPFVCIRNNHAINRFTSLFKKLEINIPLIESVEDLTTYKPEYDVNKVNSIIKDIRENALNKIESEMNQPKKDYNIEHHLEKYSEKILKKRTLWYKKNKLFYFGVIVPFIIPIKHFIKDLKR